MMNHINLFSTKYTSICALTKIKTGIFWQLILRTTSREILCALRKSFCKLKEGFHHVLMITFPLGADAQKNSSLMGELSLTAQTSSCRLNDKRHT